jgi:hypothetical protein
MIGDAYDGGSGGAPLGVSNVVRGGRKPETRRAALMWKQDEWILLVGMLGVCMLC